MQELLEVGDKIFDENGKALHIADVISRFIQEKEKQHNLIDGILMIRSFNEGEIDLDKIDGLEDVSFVHIETISSNGL